MVISKVLTALHWPLQPQGIVTERCHPCSFCGSMQGLSLAKLDYWDLHAASLVQCEQCKLMQCDPQPSLEVLALGCKAYQAWEQITLPASEIALNCFRTFRRGVAFALSLQRQGIQPRNVLEIGPGNGYFSVGLQSVFKESKITVMDIISANLQSIRNRFGFEAIQGAPDTKGFRLAQKFDLIIMRDVLEHVINPSQALIFVAQHLQDQGFFHFITPNGWEDIWPHYCRWRLDKNPSELLLNHLNYFDPEGLKQKLISLNLMPITWYTFIYKWFARGRARKLSPKLMAPVSIKRSATSLCQQVSGNGMGNAVIHNRKVDQYLAAKWGIKYLGHLYCQFADHYFIKLRPELNVGHEIYCMAKKA